MGTAGIIIGSVVGLFVGLFLYVFYIGQYPNSSSTDRIMTLLVATGVSITFGVISGSQMDKR